MFVCMIGLMGEKLKTQKPIGQFSEQSAQFSPFWAKIKKVKTHKIRPMFFL